MILDKQNVMLVLFSKSSYCDECNISLLNFPVSKTNRIVGHDLKRPHRSICLTALSSSKPSSLNFCNTSENCESALIYASYRI